ncbi:MAG TPA: SRPBCC domain-containing protein [Caulobacteraceae bacterium]|nr:SRPBCC domain-containing protein [Caulobacteraceae bacterium]
MSSRVLVALRVSATPERAFKAFVGEIGVWWRHNPLFRFTPREPGVLSFEPGPDGRLIETRAGGKVFEIGKVRAWEPPRRLVVGWRQAAFAPEQDTEVEVTFEPVEGGETRVTVVHTGWDSVPQTHVARHGFPDTVFLTRHGEWWRTLLTTYKSRIAEDG